MPEARTISITSLRPTTQGPAISAFRANPLIIQVNLDPTRESLTGIESLNVEIRDSVTDTESPLARTILEDPEGEGPFELELTGAQMNQDLDGESSRSLWLVVYTLDDDGETLDVLYTAPLTLKEHGASQAAAAPPNVVGTAPASAVTTVTNITLTEDYTLANPDTVADGVQRKYRFRQDSTGHWVVTLANKFRTPNSASPLPWSTDPDLMDRLTVEYVLADDKWDVVSFIPGYPLS